MPMDAYGDWSRSEHPGTRGLIYSCSPYDFLFNDEDLKNVIAITRSVATGRLHLGSGDSFVLCRGFHGFHGFHGFFSVQDLQALCKPLGFSLLTAELNELKDLQRHKKRHGCRYLIHWIYLERNIYEYLESDLFGTEYPQNHSYPQKVRLLKLRSARATRASQTILAFPSMLRMTL